MSATNSDAIQASAETCDGCLQRGMPLTGVPGRLGAWYCNQCLPKHETAARPNPLADATMDELKIVRVSLVRHAGNPRVWLATVTAAGGGYFHGQGDGVTSALDAALRTLAEKRGL